MVGAGVGLMGRGRWKTRFPQKTHPSSSLLNPENTLLNQMFFLLHDIFSSFFFFYDKEPHQGRALQTHPWVENPGHNLTRQNRVSGILQDTLIPHKHAQNLTSKTLTNNIYEKIKSPPQQKKV
jgi:hypothetical protein